MEWIRLIYTRIYGLFFKDHIEQDMDEEMRFHLEMRIKENIARGMSAQEAREKAQLRFGNVTQLKERCRNVRGGGILEMIFKDLQYGFRRMIKNPGFTILALLSLAIGIGANTVIFSLVNAVFFHPIPVKNPSELVAVYPVGKDQQVKAFSYPNYRDFRDRNEVFSGFYVIRFAPIGLSQQDRNERIWGYLVSGNYFDVLGVKPYLGNMLTQQDDLKPLAHPVAVISYQCWQKYFNSDPKIVGKEITLNGHSYIVNGVAPKGFSGTEMTFLPDVWVPMMMANWIEPNSNWLENRGTQNIFAVGRLKPGVSEAQAEASLNVLAAQLGKEYPRTNEGEKIFLSPTGLIHPMFRNPVVNFTWALVTIVALMLLLTCTNLASLLLAKAVERRREIGIRLSLGATRSRIVFQLLSESILLSLIGGFIGLLLAWSATQLLSKLQLPLDFPMVINIPLDLRVLVFSIFISTMTGLIFGLIPALQATKLDLVPVLKEASAQAGYRRSKLRSGLVIAQIAISLVLLIAAGLVIRTLQDLRNVDPGFKVKNGLIMSIDLGLQGYDKVRSEQFYQQATSRLSALPGVESASLTTTFPLSIGISYTNIFIEGEPGIQGAEVPSVMYSLIGSNYFKASGTTLLLGRDFNEQDNKNSPQIAIVNEAFVKMFFPNIKDPAAVIGKRISTDEATGPFAQIVGIAKDGKYFTIGETTRPFIYLPLSQNYSSNATIIVRTATDPQLMIAALRKEIANIDSNLPVFNIKTLVEHLNVAFFPAQMAAIVLGVFGAVALFLAAIGIGGVMSYSVAQRTREIGIRLALGAKPRDILQLVLKQGLTLASIGLIIGIVLSIVIGRLISGLLYTTSPTDTITFISVSILFSMVVLIACYIPARKAIKVDPMVTLRFD